MADNGGSMDIENQISDDQIIDTPVETVEPDAPATDNLPDYKNMSIRETILDARDQTQKPPRQRDPQSGKFVAGAKQATPTPDQPISQAPEGKTDTAKPQKGPPERLSPEMKAQWDSLPPSVQAEFQKIDADSSKGFEKFKSQYREYDQALEPLLPTIQRMGFTPAQVLQRSLSYAAALAGPDKYRAAFQLLRDFGIDPSNLAGTQPQNSPQQQINPDFAQYVETLVDQRVRPIAQHFTNQQMSSTAASIAQWAKDKPHYEAVRQEMGQLINAGMFRNQQDPERGLPDLDAAYKYVVWAKDETRALELQNQANQRTQEQRQAAQKAMKASVSLTSTAPGVQPKPNGVLKGRSAREDIVAAFKEVRGSAS